jgi:hypothetical protein
MMRSSLSTFARRAAPVLVRSKVALPTVARVAFSTSMKGSNEVPHFERELQGGLNAEQLIVLNEMFGKLETLETQVRVLHKKVEELHPTFGVDAPDGDPDGHELEEILEVNHIIEEAALHEDKQFVDKVHKLEDATRKFHARDTEHDW